MHQLLRCSSAHTCTYVQHTKLVLLQVPLKALHYGVKSQEPVQPPDSALRKNPTVDSSDKSHNDMRRALIHYINLLYTSVCCVCTLKVHCGTCQCNQYGFFKLPKLNLSGLEVADQTQTSGCLVTSGQCRPSAADGEWCSPRRPYKPAAI